MHYINIRKMEIKKSLSLVGKSTNEVAYEMQSILPSIPYYFVKTENFSRDLTVFRYVSKSNSGGVVFLIEDEMVVKAYYFDYATKETNLNRYFMVFDYGASLFGIDLSNYFIAVKAASPDHLYVLVPKNVNFKVVTEKPTANIRPFDVIPNLYLAKVSTRTKHRGKVTVLPL